MGLNRQAIILILIVGEVSNRFLIHSSACFLDRLVSGKRPQLQIRELDDSG